MKKVETILAGFGWNIALLKRSYFISAEAMSSITKWRHEVAVAKSIKKKDFTSGLYASLRVSVRLSARSK